MPRSRRRAPRPRLARDHARRLPAARPGGAIIDIRDELENGCGMVKLRGVPVGRYTEEHLRSSITVRQQSRHAAHSRTAGEN